LSRKANLAAEREGVQVPIKAIEEDANGRLLVIPSGDHGSHYEYIYRAGNGLRWDSSRGAVVAYEPVRWSHRELLPHIIKTVESEYGDTLIATDETSWKNLRKDVEQELSQALPRVG
jgi:hypothetical protein